MNRKAQKASTHARVLVAARASFADRDVREVSMQDVADRAETSIGALYVHYRSRDMLMAAVVASLQDELVRALKEALSTTSHASVSKAIRRLASAYLAELRLLRPFTSLYADHTARAMSVDHLRTGGASGPLQQMVSATFASLSASVPMSVDVATLVSSLLSLWRGAGLSYLQRSQEDEATVARSLALLTEALCQGVCPRLLELDARQVTRAMAQYLKEQSFIVR